MSIHTILKAGLVAVTLGTAAIAVAPAQAAPFPFPFFNIQINPGPGNYNGNGNGNGYNGNNNNYCANDYQVVQLLHDQGFHKVSLKNNQGHRVWAVAIYQGQWYQLRIDRCSGKVDHVHPINYNGYGNFNFSLNF